MSPLLSELSAPDDLRRLDVHELTELAAEIRAFLVRTVSRTGGHLGPNLGVVELTLALHRVFSSPRDVLLWDTGHQAYVHKLLTGRQDGFERLRQRDGLSGYPNRAESDHDHVENSHASTALAYADGLAKAFALQGKRDRAVVAVIGDGALTGGLAWEALNNLGAAPDRPVVVVLNDNGRSYDPTVGGLARHLAQLRTRERGAQESAEASEPTLFEALGLAYLGPVDGHDVLAVEVALRQAVALGVPVVLHCVTTKGCGYPAAETDEADRLHSVPAAALPRPAQPRPERHVPAVRAWTDVLAEELVDIGEERSDVVAVTAAMRRPVGLYPFSCRFPDRVFDVGIAEQQAVTSAAGLAMGGLHPVVCIYATFLNRALDQVLMDVALHRMPITFVLDRAGITGEDGPSHHGMWDLSLLGVVPGLRVAAPRDSGTLQELLREAVDDAHGPTALRFPKGKAPASHPAVGRVGNADVLVAGARPDVLLVPVGPLAGLACAAAAELGQIGISATVVDPRWVQPVEPALLHLAGRYRLVVTLEDGVRTGGFGDAVAAGLRATGRRPELLTLGLPPEFVPHGRREDLLAAAGLHVDGIVERVRAARTVLAATAVPA